MKIQKVTFILLMLCGNWGGIHTQTYEIADKYLVKGYKAIDKKNWMKAVDYLVRSVNAEKACENPRIDQLFYTLVNTSNAYFNSNQIENAIKYRKESLLLSETLFGIDHLYYHHEIDQVGLLFKINGQYSLAIPYHLQSIEFTKHTFGKEHSDYSRGLNNLALLYNEIGEYNKAIPLYLESLKNVELNLGKNHPEFSVTLNNLAISYKKLGEYHKAIPLIIESLENIEKNYGKEHSDYGHVLNTLAVLYKNIGEYDKSIHFYLESLRILNNTLGEKAPIYAIILSNIGNVYREIGKFDKALQYQLNAIETAENTLGKSHSDYGICLSNLAVLYNDTRQYDKAIPLYLESLENTEISLGKEHPNYGTVLSNLAFLYQNTNQPNKAHSLFHQSLNNTFTHYQTTRLGLQKNAQQTFKNKLENNYFIFTNSSIQNKLLSDTLYQYWLNINGLLASDQNILLHALQSSKDNILIETFEDLKLTSIQINKAYELTIEELTKRGIDVNQLITKKEQLEASLSKQSNIFANMTRTFDLEDVQRYLKPTEVLVDIMRVPMTDFNTIENKNTVYYVACIIQKEGNVVYETIEMTEEDELTFFEEYADFTFGEYKKSTTKDKTSYSTFWQPIASKINEFNTVYVALGGIYNSINLNTLYNAETDKYLVEEKTIHIVNSSRDFVLLKEQTEQGNETHSIALFGYPNYNADLVANIETDLYAETRDLNTILLDSLTRGGFNATLLPGTKKEVETIASLFLKKKWQIKKHLEHDATEANLKSIQNPRILHIATHGYFFEDIPQANNDQRFMGIESNTVVHDPLLRSGLLFAGANKTLQGEKVTGENGLLTAAEARMLNLKETQLVVLSACETGKGEVKNSEGVYGLRKAFADAGAKNIIMSLWKVDDAVTQEFMTLFYEIWLNDKTSIREAFNKTQLEIKAKYPQPYYWGAFILVEG